ncbi:hypothetical protein GDO81_012548 [Engystomops pustulosus]|uniref:Uncharacterized protein n=1 Tax=Engystomops pustulosus TaxID=76066 RepID=A0AAV7BMQ1_ENGPU|nr:hypothetical protein GDO81_012548 [Engystomops pustulosus]
MCKSRRQDLMWDQFSKVADLVHVSCICAGLVAATLGTPADVIKTRIMNQPRDKHGRGILYKSSTDCFIQAVRGEGFMSLYKGFIPTWMRMVTRLQCIVCVQDLLQHKIRRD